MLFDKYKKCPFVLFTIIFSFLLSLLSVVVYFIVSIKTLDFQFIGTNVNFFIVLTYIVFGMSFFIPTLTVMFIFNITQNKMYQYPKFAKVLSFILNFIVIFYIQIFCNGTILYFLSNAPNLTEDIKSSPRTKVGKSFQAWFMKNNEFFSKEFVQE